MDDFNIISLRESRNEWCMRLVNILTPKISEGIGSIFISSRKLCVENNEPEKYLLTFQNLLTRIPQWNPEIIKEETNRILTTGNCKYLEDLITCVHIIQLKMLTYVRVGTKHKKIDLNIPKLNDFVHKVYILLARVIYQKAYLYSLEINTLERQKNNAIIETIIQECILNAIRDSRPYELIVRSYLDETDEICEELKEEIIKEKPKIKPKQEPMVNIASDLPTTPKIYQSTVVNTSNAPTMPVISSTDQSITELTNNDILKPSGSLNTNSVSDINQLDLSLVTELDNSKNDPIKLLDSVSMFTQKDDGKHVLDNLSSIGSGGDNDISLCELPSTTIESPITQTLDYIELN